MSYHSRTRTYLASSANHGSGVHEIPLFCEPFKVLNKTNIYIFEALMLVDDESITFVSAMKSDNLCANILTRSST